MIANVRKPGTTSRKSSIRLPATSVVPSRFVLEFDVAQSPAT
jgi:hypothetical protein